MSDLKFKYETKIVQDFESLKLLDKLSNAENFTHFGKHEYCKLNHKNSLIFQHYIDMNYYLSDDKIFKCFKNDFLSRLNKTSYLMVYNFCIDNTNEKAFKKYIDFTVFLDDYVFKRWGNKH